MTDTFGPYRPIRPLGPSRSIAMVAVALLLVVGGAAMTTVGAAQTSSNLPAEAALHIAVDDDGSARVTLVVPFDLATEDEREAFEALQANATAREQRIERFASRMGAIATRAEAETGREMRISQPNMHFIERADTGIVALSVTWEGLAAASGDRLVLSEPFASGVSLDRSVHVVAPDGYRLATVSPEPTERSETTGMWAAGTSLEGFEVTFATPRAQTATQTSVDAPGFGIGIAVIALLLSTGFMLYRTRYSP